LSPTKIHCDISIFYSKIGIRMLFRVFYVCSPHLKTVRERDSTVCRLLLQHLLVYNDHCSSTTTTVRVWRQLIAVKTTIRLPRCSIDDHCCFGDRGFVEWTATCASPELYSRRILHLRRSRQPTVGRADYHDYADHYDQSSEVPTPTMLTMMPFVGSTDAYFYFFYADPDQPPSEIPSDMSSTTPDTTTSVGCTDVYFRHADYYFSTTDPVY